MTNNATPTTHNHHVKLRPYSRLMHWYRWSEVYIPLFNPAARLALKIKQLKDQYTAQNHYQNTSEQAEKWFQEAQLFFIFSSPRSGTVFLTDLFSQEIKGIIEHEANIVDYLAYTKAIQSKENALSYIVNFRKKDIWQRVNQLKEDQKETNIDLYGEVNPFLRLHCAAIRETLPNARLIHLIRDGRQVVRSVMSRSKLGKKDPMGVLIHPPLNDPYFQAWHKMSRLEKVCWQWQYTNRYMRQNLDKIVYFEKVRSDYDYFKTEVLDYLSLEIPQEAWHNYVNTPKNSSPIYKMPPFEDWTNHQKDTFRRICGEEMSHYDYEYPAISSL